MIICEIKKFGYQAGKPDESPTPPTETSEDSIKSASGK
jgi:hypothetical protein